MDVLSPTQRFKLQDAGSYDAVSETFDRFTMRCTLPHATRVVDLAGLREEQAVLDVGTGTGIVALAAAARVGKRGSVVGIDLSTGMIQTAQAKAKQVGLAERVRFEAMDAEALDFADRSFDAVLSLFALRHFPDPGAALREMWRVLRPGGRLVVAVGSRAPLTSWRMIPHVWLRLREFMLVRAGRRLEAPHFLNALVESHLPARDRAEETAWSRQASGASGVQQLVRKAGFTSVQSRWQRFEEFFDDPEDFWELQLTFSSMARKRLSAAPELAARVKHEFLQKCSHVLNRGGTLAYPSAAGFVAAQKPAA